MVLHSAIFNIEIVPIKCRPKINENSHKTSNKNIVMLQISEIRNLINSPGKNYRDTTSILWTKGV